MVSEMSMDQVFIEDVMYLFDSGMSLRRIAFIMGCDVDTVDRIVCDNVPVSDDDLEP